MTFLYIIGGFALLVATWATRDRFRLWRLRRSRQSVGLNRDIFIEGFRRVGIPAEIPAAVYDYYGSQRAWKDFPFSANDKYSDILHDDPDDLDDDASALVKRLGMQLVSERILREYGEKPIQTLGDMVHWLDWIRQRQPSGV
jgi:hypothetical protein